ncbi:MAG: DMT family transporter [Alphaproteobacteria bacterium]|nr:DMT family transporter [Alphaproteobacteria bacterium]
MTRTATQSVKHGVLYMLGAMFIFSVLNAIVKDVTADYDPIQLVFFRCLFASLPTSLLLTMRKEWVRPSPSEWKIHLKRAVLIAFALPILFLGIGMVPLSDSMALYFSSTLFLVILSYPILREKVTVTQWLSVGIGFIGVMVIAKPGGEIFHFGAIFVIIGAFMESIYNLYGRLLSSTHNSLMITFLGSFLPSFILLIALPFVWVTPTLSGWIALISLGLGGGFGQLCIVLAYRYAPAGILAPMIYSAIIWSVILDIILWGNWPTTSLFLGCGIIIASGLMIIFSTSKQKQA